MLQLPGLQRFTRSRQAAAEPPKPKPGLPGASTEAPGRKVHSLTEAQIWTLRACLAMAGEVYNKRRQIPGMQAKVVSQLERAEAEALALEELLEVAVLITITTKEGA
jgi:hypothetical protein